MRLFTLSIATQFTYFIVHTYVTKFFSGKSLHWWKTYSNGHSDKGALITSFSELCELHEMDQYSAWLLHGGCWYFSIILMGQIKNITAFFARQLQNFGIIIPQLSSGQKLPTINVKTFKKFRLQFLQFNLFRLGLPIGT